MYWWDDVRFREVDRDMARIADLGLQEARIFLLWEAFQPRPDCVSDDALLRLETALRAAERHEVGLVMSLFCGHTSGLNWLPGWAVDQSAASTIRSVSGGRVVPGGAATSTPTRRSSTRSSSSPSGWPRRSPATAASPGVTSATSSRTSDGPLIRRRSLAGAHY
jgi:hypothetical protein